MLITFEGQDGAGKSALLAAVYKGLRSSGVEALAVEEFSDSPYGQRLTEAVARDKFLRPVDGEPATLLTRVLDEVADLYYLDECVIGPALARGLVVLKDRHADTILYALAPLLTSQGKVSTNGEALAWLRSLMSQLRHPPDLTVYVDTPLETRLERIARRDRHLEEHRANEVSDADLAAFAARDVVIRKLLSEDAGERLVVSKR